MPTKCFPSETEVESENEQKIDFNRSVLLSDFANVQAACCMRKTLSSPSLEIIYIEMQNTTSKKCLP